MKRNKSFEGEDATLYIVATPIGNLSEMTPRAIEVLQSVDYIAAEDTRTSQKLLSYFDIHTKCIAHHKFNEKQSSDGIVQLLESGKNVALISDAGYPLISDPGHILVGEVVDAGFKVVPISGSSALLNAVVASALPTNHFLFYGFLDAKQSARSYMLESLKDMPFTMVFYEAPHRIQKTLTHMLQVFGNRNACIGRELTKKHEEFLYGTLEELSQIEEYRGELVLVVEGKQKEELIVSLQIMLGEVEILVEQGHKAKDAIKEVAKKYGQQKSYLYQQYHKEELS